MTASPGNITDLEGMWRRLMRDVEARIDEKLRFNKGGTGSGSGSTGGGGGILSDGGTIASATSPLPVTANAAFIVSGTANITVLAATAIKSLVLLRATGAWTLKHDGANIILAGGKDYVAIAGDQLLLISEGSGIYREVTRQGAFGGIPFDNTSVAATDGQVITYNGTSGEYEARTPPFDYGGLYHNPALSVVLFDDIAGDLFNGTPTIALSFTTAVT